jgi:hypothetical protein
MNLNGSTPTVVVILPQVSNFFLPKLILTRIARFLEGLGKLGSPLGRELVVTEEQARAVWRETAKRQRPAMTDDDKY